MRKAYLAENRKVIMNRENCFGIIFYIILPIAILVSGLISQSFYQFVGALFMLLLSLAGVVGAVGSALEKDFFSAAIISGVTIYWLIPITIETFKL